MGFQWSIGTRSSSSALSVYPFAADAGDFVWYVANAPQTPRCLLKGDQQIDVTALQSVLAKQRKGPFDLLLGTLLTSDRARRDLLIGEYDLAVEHRLGAAKILTKFGPILGLMGTLIPMGPALVGLSSGDIASMAYNMQVAFATTVIGMFTSAVGYIALHILRSYHHHDLIWLDYVNEKLDNE